MSRRRALIAAQDSGPKLLFELKNETVTSGTRITTGVAPYKSGQSITILFDFTNTANPTADGAVASKWLAFYSYDSPNSRYAFNVGKSKRDATYLKFVTQGVMSSDWSVILNGSNPSVGRQRFAFTHEADSPSATLRHLKGTGTAASYTITRPSYVAAPGYLYFGAGENEVGSLPNGTINLAQVWDGVLSDDVIDAFFE